MACGFLMSVPGVEQTLYGKGSVWVGKERDKGLQDMQHGSNISP